MILQRLSGGLGNQLFQYAAARCLADRHQTELVLDTYWYSHTPRMDTPRMYELAHYPVRARLPCTVESLWCRLHGGRITRRLPFLPRRWKHFSEKGFAFDPAFQRVPDNTYLDGFWQSYAYFDSIAPSLRAELKPVASMGDQDRAIANRMCATHSVSLHVRRGDYVSNAAAAQHGLCGLDYYRRAVQYVLDRVQTPHFFVFSDDPAWTRQNLALPGKAIFVAHNAASCAFQDLRLMSLCKHHIAANSSFSWWGAWLNDDPHKVVVYPAKWFADNRDTSSLSPPDWVQL